MTDWQRLKRKMGEAKLGGQRMRPGRKPMNKQDERAEALTEHLNHVRHKIGKPIDELSLIEDFHAGWNAHTLKWVEIRGEDDLPKWGGWFLVTRSGVSSAELLYYDGHSGWFQSSQFQLPSDRKEVIAWMPLPNPYQIVSPTVKEKGE